MSPATGQAEHERRQQPNALPQRPAIDFAAVRAAISLTAVLALLGLQTRSRRGAQQRGPCPLHGAISSTSRCFSANLHDHMFHCFKCGRSGNALDLWGQAQRLPPYDAAIDQRLNVPLPLLATGHREEETVASP